MGTTDFEAIETMRGMARNALPLSEEPVPDSVIAWASGDDSDPGAVMRWGANRAYYSSQFFAPLVAGMVRDAARRDWPVAWRVRSVARYAAQLARRQFEVGYDGPATHVFGEMCCHVYDETLRRAEAALSGGES